MKSSLSIVLVLAAVTAVHAADIQNLQLALEEDGLRVGFTLTDTFTDEVMARIRSGLETTFTMRIRVDQEREFWFNRRIRQRLLTLSCSYENISRVYRVTKSLDGNVFESVVVETESQMKKAMSTITRLKIMDNVTLARNEDYIVKVKGELLNRYVLLVVPWDFDTPWREKRFTFN